MWGYTHLTPLAVAPYLHHQLEAIPPLHLLCQVPGMKQSRRSKEQRGLGLCPPIPTPIPSPRHPPGAGKGSLHTLGQALGACGFPEQPELEAVHAPAALQALVPGVVGHVIELIPLEEVRGSGAMAALQETLGGGHRGHPKSSG